MAKNRRNELCPCGSGKKYKRCCGERSSLIPAAPWGDDLEWLKIRRTEGELVSEILEFAVKTYGRYLIDESFDAFYLRGDVNPEDINFENFFVPWLVFNWVHEDAKINSTHRL